MQAIRLSVFGTPTLVVGGQPVRLATRKALALLIYLLVEGGFHSREKLVALFWPESPPSLGFAALRNTLTRLRSALRPLEPLRADHDGVMAVADGTVVAVDLRQVEAALRMCQAGLPDVATLQAAVNAYRADFLEGFSLVDAPAFNDWATVQRERWHHRLSQILDALTRLHSDQRAFDEGQAVAHRWVRHDPLNETAYRHLMQLSALTGDRTAALDAYAQCRTTLHRELGIEPSHETVALAERIRRLPNDPPASRSMGAGSGSPGHVQLNDLAFVGRTAEHTRLIQQYEALRQGQSSIVVVQGEPGIGKTRLMSEFLRWLAVQPVEVLRGRALEAGGRLPYQPIVAALRQRLDQENAPEDLLSDVWLAELSRLLPELRERYPDLPLPTADETLARIRLPEAVARLGQALARRHPLVLFVDDIQWADAASLDLLQYLVRVWSAGGVSALLLFTLRTETRSLDPGLGAWLAGLARDLAVVQLSLDALSAAETGQLASAVVGDPQREATDPASAFARWLYSETAGQPLFITESLKGLLEQGLLQHRTNSAGRTILDFTEPAGPDGASLLALQRPIPSGVRQLIALRLTRLTRAARSLLTSAAVLGRDGSLEELRSVAELDEAGALLALEDVLNSRLLLEIAGGSLRYRFSHDRIRDVVYGEAGDAWRQTYHRRAFHLLEQRAAPPAELAHHALAARLDEPAFRYSLAAGDADMKLFAVPNAVVHYEQARRLIAEIPVAPPDLHRLYARLGRAYELRGANEQAEAIGHEMLERARAEEQPRMACAALNRLASLSIYSQRMARATAFLTEAHDIAEGSGDTAGLAQTEWSLGQLTHHTRDFASSRRHSERALALAKALGDSELISGASQTLAFALVFLGKVDEAAPLMEAARQGYVAQSNRALEADALVGLAQIHLMRGDAAQSVAAARSAYTLSCEIDNAFGQATSQAWLACGLADQGTYEEAVDVARRNLAAVWLQTPLLKILAAFSAAWVFWSVGDTRAAAAVLDDLHPVVVEAGIADYLEQYAAHRCAIAARAGRWPVALDYARQALANRTYQALPHFVVPHWPETDALLRGGDDDRAREDLQRWGKLIGDVPRYRPLYLRALAHVAHRAQRLDEAIAHLEEALRLAERLKLAGEPWQILLDLEPLVRAAGQRERAVQLKTRAHDLIQALAERIGSEPLRTVLLAAARQDERRGADVGSST